MTEAECVAAAREAIERLGYIRPEYDGTVAIILEEAARSTAGAAVNAYLAAGEQLSADDKKAIGLGSTTRFSYEALDALTARGLQHPIRAHLITLTAALRRLRWIEACHRAEQHGTDRLKIIGPHRDCRGCLGLSGRTISTNDIAYIPPADCDLELCELVLQPWPEWLP